MSSREWPVAVLGDLCEKIGSGITPRGGENAYKSRGISLIRSQNVHDLQFSQQGLVFIDDEQAKKMSGVKVEPGDVLLNITGDSVARCCMAPPNMLPARVNQHVAIIRPDSTLLNSRFLLYFLNSRPTKEILLSLSYAGGTRKALTKGMLEALTLPKPEVTEQEAIAATLSCLDDKMELNNSIIKTLEEMAQALFKSWFVDFEPFQDGEFEDSELGPIPKGWRVGSLGDMADISSGKRPRNKSNEFSLDATVPVLGASSIMGYTSEALHSGSIIVTGRVGTHGIVQRIEGPCWPSDNTLVITGHRYEFLYQVLLQVDFRSMNRGSTQPLITQTDLRNVSIIIPPDEALDQYEYLASSLMALWHRNQEQNGRLSSIRDTLLPKLMSGEIRVPIEEVQ